LRDGGYYFAINDNWDLKLTGEIFTKGSWGIGAQTTYKKRYKYSGNFYFNYQVSVTGEKNLPDYSKVTNFKLQWSHKQDAKASPNSSFSASVNFTTQSYEKNNLTSLYNPTSYAQSTRTSSVSYSRSFPSIGLSLSSSMNLTQNLKDSTINLSFPNLSINLQRIYPFRRKKMVGKERWYEKISMYYKASLQNSIQTKEDKLLKSNLVKDWKNGIKHSIPIQASFQVLKYINVVPSFNYEARWYTRKVEQSWDQMKQAVVRDTIYGFNHVHNYNLGVQVNTKLFGFYKFNPKVWGQKLQMVRHVFTPTVNFSYAPDFGASRYGYHKYYTKTDLEGNVSQVAYSPYEGAVYSYPGKGKSGIVSFDVGNNIEMKIKSDKDSTGVKKISIIDELGANLSYNMAAKEKPWGNLSTRLRLKWGKVTFNMNTTWMTYAYQFDQNGNVVEGNRTEWSYGRWGRFTGTSKNLSYTFNNQSWSKIKKSIRKLFGHDDDEEDENKSENENENEGESENDNIGPGRRNANQQKGKKDNNELDEDGYMKFNIPWSFSISYGITMSEDRSAKINKKTMRYPYKFVQNLNFSG
ncbi:MAG: LPS-assembly protein LptD, partial [Bacteroidaceae bacterium]|nr:LPS-assembly protein LptD [Bacteroidaceae bacterium]